MPETKSGSELEGFLEALWQERLIFFPVRHHSLVCGLHLRDLIRQEKPAAILIEGPRDWAALVDDLVHPETIPPIAVYVDAGRADAPGGAYYPFCLHSPEYVAVIEGRLLGAAVEFIDLTWKEQQQARSRRVESEGLLTTSLLNEWYLAGNPYLESLVKRTGCRDDNEVWDHLFEARFRQGDYRNFTREVGAYCWFLRQSTQREVLAAEGNLEREAAMLESIGEALNRETGRILVVTGGFHTPALVHARAKAAPRPAAAPEAWLIPYSHQRLDQLNGYSAGMPSPAFYGRLWDKLTDPGRLAEAADENAHELVVEALAQMRGRGLAVTSSDAIQCLAQARGLASLRGHGSVQRTDLLDAVLSCFVHEESAVLHDIEALMLRLLSSGEPGRLPSTVRTLPLVVDFYRCAKSLGIPAQDVFAQQRTLDVYRTPRHREISRFFHRLQFIGVPFCRLRAGGGERRTEVWEWNWSPQTESGLIDLAPWGGTTEEAARTKLRSQLTGLADQSTSNRAEKACRLLVTTFQIGLHSVLPEMVAAIRTLIAEEGVFLSLVRALQELQLLWQSKESLEAWRVPEIPVLMDEVFGRACSLVSSLRSLPPDALWDNVAALVDLGDLASTLDREFLDSELGGLWTDADCPGAVRGAAGGLLHHGGGLAIADLLRVLQGQFASASSQRVKVEFLRGILISARELAWQDQGLLGLIDGLLVEWDDETFLELIPELRLAFSTMTPRETDRIAYAVAGLHGSDLGSLRMSVSAEAVVANRRRSAAVEEVLVRDGLWPPEAAHG